MVVTPTLELAERNQDQLTARNELDGRLDAALKGVEAHAEACGGLFAAEEQARDGLERTTDGAGRTEAARGTCGWIGPRVRCGPLSGAFDWRWLTLDGPPAACPHRGVERQLSLCRSGSYGAWWHGQEK